MIKPGRDPSIAESIQGIPVGNSRQWLEQPFACYCLYHAVTTESGIPAAPSVRL